MLDLGRFNHFNRCKFVLEKRYFSAQSSFSLALISTGLFNASLESEPPQACYGGVLSKCR